jgi:hypothetical protein
MQTSTELDPHAKERAARGVREECQYFWQGVIESFGVEWRCASRSAKKDSNRAAAPSATLQLFSDGPSTANSTLSTPSPLVAPSSSVTEKTSRSSPLHVNTTTCPTPATPSSVSTRAKAEGWCSTSASSSNGAPPVQVALMPPWSLVEYDPKLWMLLRKNLLANLALTALTLTYTVLSHRLATSSAASSPSSTSAREAVSWWWWRLCLWVIKYMGQWPFYTVLQTVGLVWYSQLYRETWLVRKGWVLRGTRLREASAPSELTGSSPPPSKTTSAFLPPLLEGVTRPWLASRTLLPASLGRNSVPASAAASHRPAWCPVPLSLTLYASAAYCRHVTALLLRMLRHKGPTTPLQEWVIGDAAAAARHVASITPQAPLQATSPDVFESVISFLESASEVLFKTLATMSFAFFASCVQRLPLVGTPLCLLLNAQLYAFYVFDYRYAAQQQPYTTHRRNSALTYQLWHFEQCWAYYAGYGIVSAVLSLWLTHHAGVVVSVSAMSVLYSWQVVWSGFAVPLPSARPLPTFSIWFGVVDTAQKQYGVLWRIVVIIALLYIPYQSIRYV